MKKQTIDRPLALICAALIFSGFLIFSSAALGILARDADEVVSVITGHIGLGFGLGAVALFLASRISYRAWRTYAPYLYGLALFATALVFVPGIGIEAGGAHRWVSIFGVSFQPSEALKIGTVLMLAWYFSRIKKEVGDWVRGFFGFLIIVGLPGILLLLQPDTGTYGVIVIAAIAMYVAAGAHWKSTAALIAVGCVLLAALAFFRPYVFDRVHTFLNPEHDPQGSGYQIKQSLIAIGSGGLWGRGFGQSVQKFELLPEPINDSIFAVAAEEFGLIGSLTLLGLFLALGIRGLVIAMRAPDLFGALLAVGIVAYIVGQSFFNIAAMLGVIPLTGIPLVFVSQGGTALLVALGSVGILLNVSRSARVT